MTYDVLCYKPISDKPSVEEARRILEAVAESAPQEKVADPDEKWRIASALVKFDPRLRPADLDPVALADMLVDAEKKAKMDCIRLSNFIPQHESIQLSIWDDSVGITIPYWFEGPDINRVFALVSAYLRVIRETAGYFVYDPQARSPSTLPRRNFVIFTPTQPATATKIP